MLALVLSGVVQLYTDERILAEYKDVLFRPRFKFDPAKVGEILAKLKTDGISVNASEVRDLKLPDPDDEPFLAVALAASTDFLVTGNLSDYPPEKRKGCAIVSPTVFMECWRNRPL